MAVFFIIAIISQASGSSASINYHIYIEPGGPGHVEAILEGADGTSVAFLMVSDGNPRVDLVGNISDVEAIGPDGALLSIKQVNDGRSISTLGQSKLTFRYSFGVSLQDSGEEGLGRYYSRVTDEGAFFLNNAIFAYPEISLQEIQVVFHAPDQWAIGTSFIPEGNNTFRVEGAPDLRTDLLFNVTRLGIAQAIVSETCGDIEINFIAYNPPSEGGYWKFWYPHYGNTQEEQMHEYIQLVCDSIQYLKSLMGDWPGGSHYWISTNTTENENPMYYERWMQAWPRERYQQVPHHVLHAWIWWGPNAPIQLNAPEWMWVQEGIPTFYEKQLTPFLTGNSVWRGMSFTNYLIVKRAAQFDLLEKTDINKYAYGGMRALAMDRAIRQATDKAKSMDNLLSLLNERFGRERQHFSREELIQAVNDVSGTDLTAFYNNYFAGEVSSELPPLDDYIVDYQDEFLEWIDAFVAPNGLGSEAGGSRTMFFIALEIAIQVGQGVDSEHYISTGAGISNLQEFETRMRELNNRITGQGVISVLSSITGVPEDDFFDFYTVGDYRPSVDEIQAWLGGDGSNVNPIVSYNNGLAVDFGTSWSQLSTNNPQWLTAYNGNLAADFGATYGLYSYDGSAWSQISTSDPDN